MYVVNIIFDDVSLDTVDIYRTMVDAYMWHRRMGYCNPRALHQLTDKDQSGVKFNRHINSGDCEVCSAGNNEKSSHPLLIVPAPKHGLRSCTRTCGGSIP